MIKFWFWKTLEESVIQKYFSSENMTLHNANTIVT